MTAADNDGRVTVKELMGAFKETTLREHALSAFKSIDLNKNCVLTFSEYMRRIFPYANDREFKVMLSWVKPAQGEQQEPTFEPTAEQRKEIATMFKRMDANKDGVLEVNELVAASAVFGYDESEVMELFNNTDKNMNGLISFDEFIQLMKVSYI
ncbi:hypothetical protein VOLCADRAFT_94189 [Volvox carteri f. nagariensis]|uniref:EF-hand domain-containing protein n=1 Tax=Volvox carteri f. nagariensis TaxID=3068 RepID=D8U4D3_VOLCA|nr:uncharacterized protein VOLCADRAFT_94189 [Volvox carteri f. nagariensis]EFJ45481.1 hypothetical protein VOLCADRAFT_94189 [Volvox carteri f. nagariensis]|eukprot:XP_002953508.1 hypothetical protein VOLCADRAFT_94189 [Volvox carteri f. nagariensis]